MDLALSSSDFLAQYKHRKSMIYIDSRVTFRLLIESMSKPNCPSCESKITLMQGLKFANPKKMNCPHCGVGLQYAGFANALSKGAPIQGLAIAGIAIYMEQAGHWEILDSVIFFVATISILLIIGALLWPVTTFKIKPDDIG